MTRATRLRALLAVLVLTSFTLLSLDRLGGGGGLAPARAVTDALLGPLQRAAAATVRPVAAAVGAVPHLAGYRRDADRLRRENDALRAQLATTELDRQRAAELDQLLKVSAAGKYPTVPARVVALGSALGFDRTATLDAGSRDGVRPDMTVVNGAGLVGRVVSVAPFTATVLLAADGTSAVGARLEGSLQVGLVHGGGPGPMTLELLDPEAQVKPGDRLVTLGSPQARPFVPGVPLGTVTSVSLTPGALTRTAQVAPSVRYGTLDLVGVVTDAPRTDPRDTVLPAVTP